MKIVITKQQYKELVFKLLDTLVGELRIVTSKEKKKLGLDTDFHDIYDKHGDEVMSIWIKGIPKNKGCKNDLTILNDLTEKMEGFIPYYKHKIFAKVLSDYVYKYTDIKCDCVQYEHGFKHMIRKDGNDEEYDYTDSKTRIYNLKKKKRLKDR